MATRASSEPIRGLIVTALAESDRPVTTSDLRRKLAVDFDVYVLNETLYRSLSILERRGDVAKIDSRGRSAQWQLLAELRRPQDTPSGCQLSQRGWQTATDCVKIVRTDGVLLHVNKRGCEALGLPDDECDFGMPWLELLPEHSRGQGLRALNRAAEGSRSKFSGITFGPDGQPQYWDNVLTPIESDDGRIREILCISRDITAQVRQRDVPPERSAPRTAQRGGAVADRLNRLFAAIRAPGHGCYTNSEVLRALADRGVHISAPYLSQLRSGNRKRPSGETINALAEFFGVLPVYFADTYDEEELRYLARLDADLHWLQLAHDAEVRRLTTVVLQLPPKPRHEMLTYLDRRAHPAGDAAPR